MAFTDSCWPGYETQPTRPGSSFPYGCYSMYTVPKIIHKNLAVRAWADAASVWQQKTDIYRWICSTQYSLNFHVAIFLDVVFLQLLSFLWWYSWTLFCYDCYPIVITKITFKHCYHKVEIHRFRKNVIGPSLPQRWHLNILFKKTHLTIDSFPCLPRFNKKPWFIQSTVFIYFLIRTIVCAVQ